MSKITAIQHKPEKRRYWIFVDHQYCTSIRERTFSAMRLRAGQEITCEEIKELENHHWKHSYGTASWEAEKVRLDKVKALIEGMSDEVITKITGFGAETTAFVHGHPPESGKPDIEVHHKQAQILLLLIEVTGTEQMRGSDYWVRPDKLAYARNHPDEDVWLTLHYAQPQECFVFIKPDNAKNYAHREIEIRGSIEHYVIFSNMSPEVVSKEQFFEHLRMKIQEVRE